MISLKDVKISRKKAVHIFSFCCALFVLTLACVVLLNSKFDKAYVSAVGLLGGMTFLVFAYAYCVITRRVLSFGLIFTAMLFLFCFGQFFLCGLGVKYDYFFEADYYRSLFGYDDFYVLYGEIVSALALGAFQLSMLLWSKPQDRALNDKSNVEDRAAVLTAKILFAFSFPVMIVYKFYCLSYALINGYASVSVLEQPFLIRFVGVFFIPASIMLLVAFRGRVKRFKLICTLLIAYSVIGLAIGGRTEPLILLTGITALILRDKKIKARTIIYCFIGGYVVVTLMVSVADIRVAANKNFLFAIGIFLENLVTFRSISSLVGEMGFSGSSTVWTIYLIKTGRQEFYYGTTYVGAVANILPSSMDVFGLLSGLNEYCYLEGWLTETLNFNFGVGFNLIAEAYLNFGVGAIGVMFVYAAVLNRVFDYARGDGVWNTYKALVMFAVLMTLPRRASLYFADQWALCVVAIWLLCRLVELFFKNERSKN